MLQYFFPKTAAKTHKLKYSPQLEYFCKITPESNLLPRVLHKHPHICEIIFIYRGHGSYFIDNRIYEVAKGDLIICNADSLHEEIFSQQKTLGSYCLGISNLQLDKLPKNHLLETCFNPVLKTRSAFEALEVLCQEIYREIHSCQKPNKEYCNHLLQGILAKLLLLPPEKKSPASAPDTKLALDTKRFIESNYTDALNLTAIAQALKANKYYISHLFKEHFGYPLHQYIIRLRIGEAQNLLINTELNITDIALKVGYNNSNYFQNVFREYIGLTPRKYRMLWRG